MMVIHGNVERFNDSLIAVSAMMCIQRAFFSLLSVSDFLLFLVFGFSKPFDDSLSIDTKRLIGPRL